MKSIKNGIKNLATASVSNVMFVLTCVALVCVGFKAKALVDDIVRTTDTSSNQQLGPRDIIEL